MNDPKENCRQNWTLEQLRLILGRRRGMGLPCGYFLPQASVAVIFRSRPSDGEIELLFIRRAKNPADPWSGHIAFPGGRKDPEDRDLLSVALRETREEIGLELRQTASFIGRLSRQIAHAGGRQIPLAVNPHLFILHEKNLHLDLLNDEVSDLLWVPLAFFCDPHNRSSMPYTFKGFPIKVACYRFRGHVIWGLTLRIIDEMIKILRHSSS